MRAFLLLSVVLLAGCRIETPYHHLPQGYSDTYRRLLTAEHVEGPPQPVLPQPSPTVAPELPLPPEPPMGPPDADVEENASPLTEVGHTVEASEASEPPTAGPGSDVDLVLPPEVKRAPSLRSLIPKLKLFSVDDLPPLP